MTESATQPAATTPPASPTATSAPQRPRFSIREAADACQIHPDSIRRRLNDLAEHGAEKDDAGAWSIPVEALLAVGLKPGRPSAPDSPTPPLAALSVAGAPSSSEAEALRQEVAMLKHRLELEQVRRETAERLVDVHKMALDESRAWRRILEAGPSAHASPTAVSTQTAESVAPQHRAPVSRLQNVLAAMRGA